MKLAARIEKLETAFMERTQQDPYQATLEKDFRDWINHEPKAADLLKKEYRYCVSKGYPTSGKNADVFYEELDDPEFNEMNKEIMDLFSKYLKGRPAV